VLHTHTGAEIWALGVWRNLHRDLHYTEYVLVSNELVSNLASSNHTSRALSGGSDAFRAEQGAAAGRQGFVEFQISRNCKC
jgi:hypothetical protein